MCANPPARAAGACSVVRSFQGAGRKTAFPSGGGRAKFYQYRTLRKTSSRPNPHFAKSALGRYTQHDFIALVEKHASPGTKRRSASSSATIRRNRSLRCSGRDEPGRLRIALENHARIDRARRERLCRKLKSRLAAEGAAKIFRCRHFRRRLRRQVDPEKSARTGLGYQDRGKPIRARP